MKLNTKDINKILDENTDPIDSVLDEVRVDPCWEVKIDKEKNKMVFLIDKSEKFSTSLSKFKSEDITVDLLSSFLQLLKQGKMEELKKAVKR